jgi:phage repressor protein C with HTH and peptisase S24 domain/DNA-binding XRE family transcriptional regulator
VLRRQVEEQLGASRAFAERLKELRRQRKMTLDELARASGISKAYLSQIENGRVVPPRDDKVRRLEEVFGERPRALVELSQLARMPEGVRLRLEQLQSAFARAEQTMEHLWQHAGAAQPQADPGADGAAEAAGSPQPVRRRIAIINRVAAGYPAEFTDLGYPAGVADDYLSAPPELDDPQAFAVRVVGDSMEPRYREGDIVLFSPRAAVRSGDDCFVRFAPECTAAQGATFKRVYFDSELLMRLQPLNNRYPPQVVPLKDIAGLYKAVFRYEAL